MKAPAFQFYPADWLSSQRVQMMTLEEEGAYIRLLCYCWSHGSIPSDPVQIERLLGKRVSTDVATNVQRMFEICSDDPSRMIQRRLEEERERQEARREQTSKAGRKSAETRKNSTESKQKSNERSTDVATDVENPLQRKSNPSSSSSSSTAYSPLTPKGDGKGGGVSDSLVPAILAAYPRGGGRVAAEKFLAELEQSGHDMADVLRKVLVHAERFPHLPPHKRDKCPGPDKYFRSRGWEDNPDEAPWVFDPPPAPSATSRKSNIF